MNVLVLCDDTWHPARVPRDGLAGLGASGFSFDFIESVAGWSPERIVQYPLVILTKSDNSSSADKKGWMTEAIQMAFLEYVRKGNGLLAIHSGTAGWGEMSIPRGLLGGVFDHHPPECPVTVEPLPGHPLTAGCKKFKLRDEHYFMTLDDTQADIFLTTKSEHGEQPGGWRRREEAGRVGVLTPGHYAKVWLHPSFQAVLRNTINWCWRKD